MTAFATAVYTVVRRIPLGRVMTYAEVARAIGRPRAMRAVGNALHHNPDMKHIPCHRVVRSNGTVGGYIHGVEKKRALLMKEKIPMKGRKIDWEEYSKKSKRKVPNNARNPKAMS